MCIRRIFSDKDISTMMHSFSAFLFPVPTIMVSGGRIGTQVECAPADLIKVTRGKTAAITQEHQA